VGPFLVEGRRGIEGGRTTNVALTVLPSSAPKKEVAKGGPILLGTHDHADQRQRPKVVTTMADSTFRPRLRLLLVIAGGALALQAAVLGVLVTLAPEATATARGPVTFDGHVLSQVNILVGALVLLCLAAVSFLLLASPAIFPRYAEKLTRNRHDARWVVFSLTSSITVFLVAQLNGICDIGTLVLIYAATSAMTLFNVVAERMPAGAIDSRDSRVLALSFGAAVGIVPWGIIAFTEIAASIVGEGPSAPVRVITLLMLAAAFVFAVTNWSDIRRPSDAKLRLGDVTVPDLRGERAFIVLSAVAASAFAWGIFAGVIVTK